MKKITEEQKLILNKYEYLFNMSINQNYIVGVSNTQFDEVLNIYKEITGSEEQLKNNCSYCVLQLFKKIGEIYYGKY